MTLIEAVNIRKVYGGKKGARPTEALRGVDLKIARSELVGVMGPSGSGKTTLLNLLGGIDRADSGRIRIEGAELGAMQGDKLALFRRRRLGFVFQEFNLLDSLTLRENIILPLILDKVPGAEMERRAATSLRQFGIEEIAGKYPYTVSGGEQQRAAVARAIINDPAVVFADEPTGNLDSKSARAVMECFARMNKEQQSTILMVTHDAFAASYCSRIIFLKDGQTHMQIASKGDRKQFFEQILDCLAVLGGENVDL